MKTRDKVHVLLFIVIALFVTNASASLNGHQGSVQNNTSTAILYASIPTALAEHNATLHKTIFATINNSCNCSHEKTVITPVGLMPIENVHQVGSGEIIVSQTTNLTGQVMTPFGLRPSSMVSEVGPGIALSITDGLIEEIDSADKVLATFRASNLSSENVSLEPGNISTSFAPTADGWITDAEWSKSAGGVPIDSFETTWVVPPAPATSSGQTIYLFNGIQSPGYILQPVLGWNNGQWSLTSWYADGATGLAFYTSSVQVNPGETLYGVITRTVLPPEMGKWEYTCQFQGKPQTILHVRNIDELTDFCETLEVYGVTKCSDYPATDVMPFKDISIKDHNGASPTLSWTAQNLKVDCGQYTDVINGGEVDIHFHTNPVALLALANNKYVCAESAGALPLIANRGPIGSWETFKLVQLSTIQSQVDSAKPGDTIYIPAGTYKENVHIDKSLTIIGAGAGNTIVDGNQAGSVFTMGATNSNIAVTLSGMTIQNGNVYEGGGIENHGALTIGDCIISGNNGSLHGGGICNYGTITMNSGSINGNTAQFGAGICNHNSVTMNGGMITGNTASIQGGGIWKDGFTLILNGGSIIGNSPDDVY